MRRLNFLQDEPWEEVNDGVNRVRWFGHSFETDTLGASPLYSQDYDGTSRPRPGR